MRGEIGDRTGPPGVREEDLDRLAYLRSEAVRELGPQHDGAHVVSARAAFAECPRCERFMLDHDPRLSVDGEEMVGFGEHR